MSNLTITCPQCGKEISLNEAVEGELRQGLEEETKKRVENKFVLQINDLNQQISEKESLLLTAQKNELDLRKRQRELDEKMQHFDLELERKLAEERQAIAADARNKVEDSYRFKLQESQKKLDDMTREIEELKRKAEQGSQQTQGEVAELDLEKTLVRIFPCDQIEPVKKGVGGADILQKVCMANGQYCGTIIWESKNTKNWNERWLSKLKEDQLTAKAEMAVLVSSVLPEDVVNFDCIEGIWVTGFAYVIGLATALREHVVQVAKTRLSSEGKDEKIEMLYRYLAGSEFKQRIELLVNTFTALKDDLEKEKKSMQAMWSKREKSLEKVVMNIAGMYGDMQGIIGSALPTIAALELPESTSEVRSI
jgi:hypothetical protein